jgi:predicted N-acetyltransferase YhbS
LRWGKFWDEIPFMNMLFVDSQERRRGAGRRLVQHWETTMRLAGHTQVLTSTLADEPAQHFYRRLGFTDGGGLLLPGRGDGDLPSQGPARSGRVMLSPSPFIARFP